MSTLQVAPVETHTGDPQRQVINDFSIQIATVNGSGSQTANSVLMRSIFQMGIPVSGKNMFPSNIAGLPTWFTIRASKQGYVARKKEIDIVVAMNAEILLVAAILSVLLFAFDESYLPDANRRQEALLSSIKGKPAQTFLRPDRKWMSGQASGSGEPTRIFYYQAFDPDRNFFANITVFEFQPDSFVLQRRIFAASDFKIRILLLLLGAFSLGALHRTYVHWGEIRTQGRTSPTSIATLLL